MARASQAHTVKVSCCAAGAIGRLGVSCAWVHREAVVHRRMPRHCVTCCRDDKNSRVLHLTLTHGLPLLVLVLLLLLLAGMALAPSCWPMETCMVS
jgi:hypothetical protein